MKNKRAVAMFGQKRLSREGNVLLSLRVGEVWHALNYRITLAMRTTDSDSVLACQCRKDRESVRVALIL